MEGNEEHGPYYWNEVTGESSEERPETMDHGSFAEVGRGTLGATGMGRDLGSFAGSSQNGGSFASSSFSNLAPIGEGDEAPTRLNVSFKKRDH